MEFVDLRSDVKTMPSAGMLRAMTNAALGDDQDREDPSVIELEERAAALAGQPEAIFVPSATMANQLALMCGLRHGEEVLAEETSHTFRYEAGGPAALAGAVMTGLSGTKGVIAPRDIRRLAVTSESDHRPRTRMVIIENTHNVSGGRVWPLADLAALHDECDALGLGVHVDGARIFNSAVALGVPLLELTTRAQSVAICFSKGLGCPAGAVLTGSEEALRGVRRRRQMLGGSLRQAGVLAAAASYALEHNVSRLAEDHGHAQQLAAGLAGAGVPLALEDIETNFVFLDVGACGLGRAEALERLAKEGVGWSAAHDPRVLRAVTHLGIDSQAIESAVERTVRALKPGA